MNKLELTSEQKIALEFRHKAARDGKEKDRIKAILLRSEGWNLKLIAQALRLHEGSIKIEAHLIEETYHHQKEIVAYIESNYSQKYSVSGLNKWLKRHGFSYKQPKGVPGKLDAKKQQEFIQTYHELKSSIERDEAIYFMESVHPTQATKLSSGWIKKGTDKHIKTTASHTRINIVGAIRSGHLSAMVSHAYERINKETINDFITLLRQKSDVQGILHLVIDQAGYHKAHAVKEKTEELNIQLHFLPPYSPNLNPIERMWKVMNEQVRNNQHFDSAKEFRQKINQFLNETIPIIGHSLNSRINDNFQIINPAF